MKVGIGRGRSGFTARRRDRFRDSPCLNAKLVFGSEKNGDPTENHRATLA
jgi:hypothetical protein